MCWCVWAWCLGLPALGYWLGQAPRTRLQAGLVCGFIAPPLVLWLPEVTWLPTRLGSGGGCGTGLRFAWMEATALMFCLPAALGQLRYTLRRRPLSRYPDE